MKKISTKPKMPSVTPVNKPKHLGIKIPRVPGVKNPFRLNIK
jgi:hypothetical protein